MPHAGGKRRHKADRASAHSESELSPETLRLQLTVSSTHLQQLQLQDCPVVLGTQQHQQQEPAQQQQVTQAQGGADLPLVAAVQQQQDASDQQQVALQLESWSQLPAVLAWFSNTVLQLEHTAKLSFSPRLAKELRADVHNHVSKKLSKVCQSVSEGLGDERYVAVVAKGAVKPACRRMTGEQQDHASALWLLWKQHSKAQQSKRQQLQQQQRFQIVQDQQQGREQAQQHGQAEPAAADVLGQLDSLTLEGTDSSSSSSSQQQQLAAAGMRVYSRDEIAQMSVQGKLTDELRELWDGPQGVEQRAARDMCLAAAAGDLQDVQVLIGAHPGLVPSAVGDLSAGGALPLHLAAAGGWVDVVQALLAADAPLEARDGKGLTALQVAQRSEQCDVEAVLMQAGAVNKQKDSWGTLDMPGGFL